MKVNCLVTGSKGFIGSKLTMRLKEIGIEVTEADLSTGIDLSEWDQLINTPPFNFCFHLASRVFIPDSFNDPHAFYSNNINSTLNILELCRIHQARLIFASTYVYGNPVYLPVDEKHPVQPNNPYTHSKIMGEELCKAYHDYFGVKVMILRPFNIFGEGQNLNFLIPSLISQAEKGKIVLDDASPRRDFLYVDDMVEAYIKAMQTEIESYEVINIGSGKSISVYEVAKLISSEFGNDVISVSGKKRMNEVKETLADVTKAKIILGWQPEYDFETAINKMISNIKKLNSNK